MRDLGVMADWGAEEQTYRTMGELSILGARICLTSCTDRKYEIRQLKLLNSMMKQGENAGHFALLTGLTISTGLITHRLRPTYYSPVSRTALAEAELSYKDGHRSNSVYVGFKVDPADMSAGLKSAYSQACKGVGEKKLLLPIWTTTPWTLPSNMVSGHFELWNSRSLHGRASMCTTIYHTSWHSTRRIGYWSCQKSDLQTSKSCLEICVCFQILKVCTDP